MLSVLKDLWKDQDGDVLQFVIIAACCIILAILVYKIAHPAMKAYTEDYSGWLNGHQIKTNDPIASP
jgi:hypothetical protein